MDHETKEYLAGMELRILQAFSSGAYELYARMASLEAAAVSLREQIERLCDHVEDTAESGQRRRLG